MSTVTITPTVELGATPPRVRLAVTDSGDPAINSVTVVRIDPNGRRVPVRTTDGGPLPLSTSGGDRVGLLYDHEVPFGQPVTFSTLEDPATVSAPVTITEDRIWLVHPGLPALSMPVEFLAGSLSEEDWDVEQAVYWPVGAEFPLVHTSGIRRAPSSSVAVAIETPQGLTDLRSLVRDTGTLLLNVPPLTGIGVHTCYIAVGPIRNARPSDIGFDPMRAVVMPFQVVGRPAGGTQATRTLGDVMAENATLGALNAKYATLFDVLAGP